MSVTANGTDANGNAGPVEISGYGGYNKIEIMSSESVAEVPFVKGVMAAGMKPQLTNCGAWGRSGR